VEDNHDASLFKSFSSFVVTIFGHGSLSENGTVKECKDILCLLSERRGIGYKKILNDLLHTGSF
jgi:hypothetical protein